MCARLSRVLIGDALGVEVGGWEARISNHYGNYRGGFVVVLPGYIHLPFRARDDPTSWKGKSDPLLLPLHCHQLYLTCVRVGIYPTPPS